MISLFPIEHKILFKKCFKDKQPETVYEGFYLHNLSFNTIELHSRLSTKYWREGRTPQNMKTSGVLATAGGGGYSNYFLMGCAAEV